VENFSAFLRDAENSIFQKVRDSLVYKLIELKEIKGTYLTFDSSNVPVKVKENKYFWVYRNFVLSDALSELPIREETKGANVVDSKVIIPQLRLAKDRFDLNICGVIADAGLDSAKVLSFIYL